MLIFSFFFSLFYTILYLTPFLKMEAPLYSSFLILIITDSLYYFQMKKQKIVDKYILLPIGPKRELKNEKNSSITTPYQPMTTYKFNETQPILSSISLNSYQGYYYISNDDLASRIRKLNQLSIQNNDELNDEVKNNCNVYKSAMSSNLLKKQQNMRNSRYIVTLLIQIYKKNVGLPRMSQELNAWQASKWQQIQLKYPCNVLHIYQLFFYEPKNVIYMVTENHSQYKPLSYFIQKRQCAITNSSNRQHLQKHLIPKHKQDHQLDSREYYFINYLSDSEILIIIKKVLQALINIREIERKLNQDPFLFVNSQDEEHQYVNFINCFNPETDVLVHPVTLDVKLSNFGFLEDFTVCTHQWDTSLANCNFLYRYPHNLVESKDDQSPKLDKYFEKYAKNGLMDCDLIWQIGLFAYRLKTGWWPFRKQDSKEKKLVRNDFQWVRHQMKRINAEGLPYNSLSFEKGSVLYEVTNKMLTFSQAKNNDEDSLSAFYDFVNKQLENPMKLQCTRILQLKHLQMKASPIHILPRQQQMINEDKIKQHKRQCRLIIEKLMEIRRFMTLQIDTLIKVSKRLKKLKLDSKQEGKTTFTRQRTAIQLTKKIICFYLTAQIRRKCIVLIQDRREDVLGPTNLRQLSSEIKIKLNDKNTQEHIKQFLLKIHWQVAECQNYLNRIIKKCNQCLISDSFEFLNMLNKIELNPQHPYTKLLRLSKYFISYIYESHQIRNTVQKEQFVLIVQKGQDQVQRIIEGVFVGLVKQIDFVIEGARKYEGLMSFQDEEKFKKCSKLLKFFELVQYVGKSNQIQITFEPLLQVRALITHLPSEVSPDPVHLKRVLDQNYSTFNPNSTQIDAQGSFVQRIRSNEDDLPAHDEDIVSKSKLKLRKNEHFY